jgi:hypothetical protein
MGLKGRLRRLEQGVRSESVILRLRDGGLRVFDQMEVAKEMFLGRALPSMRSIWVSEVLDAVRCAMPESRAAFEQEHGSIEMVGHIIAADYQGGWVEELRLLEDGRVETTHYEGGSEEALRIRQEARQRGPASIGREPPEDLAE